MKNIRPFLCYFLTAIILGISTGCATLPNVSEVIDETPTAQKPRQIVSNKGLLSPRKSKAIMDRLKDSGAPTDILERHTVVIESVTESPLTKGNRVTLLADGQSSYAAMFTAIRNAKVHINLETFILEDDEVGRKFADLLLLKQSEGVQVNIIYDSVGSLKTPETFFKRLRDKGVQVVEFNPVNPLKDHGEWFLIHPDHRKMLIVDGTVAIAGGINISKVYSGRLSDPRPRGNHPGRKPHRRHPSRGRAFPFARPTLRSVHCRSRPSCLYGIPVESIRKPDQGDVRSGASGQGEPATICAG